MPLLATSQAIPTPVDPGLAVDQAPTVTWTSAAGRETILSAWDHGYILQPGARGLGMAPITLYRRESGALDGLVITGVRAAARELFLPVRIYGEDRAEALERRRQLATDLDPMDVNGGGAGTLELAEQDGTKRRITCWYQSGMEGAEGRDEAGLAWANLGLTFLAPDPFWRQDTVTLEWRTTSAGGLWLPILPLRARDSQIVGTGMTIHNPGSARTWPIWNINGPVGTGMVLRSNTLGQELQLNAAFLLGDTVTIDTRPRIKTVRKNGTTNLYPDLQLGSKLWPLAPGDNDIDIVVSGTTSDTLVQLTFEPLDLTS